MPGMPSRASLYKTAVTEYRVQERFSGFALMHMFPKTGRTHQLRVHMSAIGHPMVGDTFYGGHRLSERDLTGQGSGDSLIDHQALHALRIELTHPIEETPLAIEAPVPANILRIIDLLREHRGKAR